MPLGYFIYYRVDPGAAALARQQVEWLFDRLERACGVRGRLLSKRGEAHLWMEVYEPVSDAAAFEARLEAEVAALAFARVLAPGARRTTECFDSCA